MEAASLARAVLFQTQPEPDVSHDRTTWVVLPAEIEKSITKTELDVLHAHHIPGPKENSPFASQILACKPKLLPGRVLALTAIWERKRSINIHAHSEEL